MNANGHLGFGIYSVTLLGAGIGISKLNLDYDTYMITQFAVGVFLGVKLPDCDHPKAPLGKISCIPFLHKIFKKYFKIHIFKHGGITHTVLVNVWIFVLAYVYESLLGAGIGFGFATHLYADDVTGNKLDMLWWPIIIKRRK